MANHAELLPFPDLGKAQLAAWRDLAMRAEEPNPFFEPHYALPLARATEQVADTALLVARWGAEWTAALPVRSLRHWHRVALPSLSTWRPHPLYALLGTPLLASDALREGARGVAGALTSRLGSSFSGLDWLVEGSPVTAALEGALRECKSQPIVFERFERAAVHRRPEPSYLEETLSPKHRRELRRQRRKLGESLGAEVEVIDRADDPAAVEELIELERRSAVAERGTVLTSDPAHAAFFREACAGFAAEGRLQLLTLRAGDVTLAAKCNFVAGDGCFMFKIAFDETYRKFSPGMQLELEMLNLFHQRPSIRWMDSCADANNAMINRLWPDRRAMVSLAAPAPGLRGSVAKPLVRGVRVLRNRKIERSQ